MNRIQLKLQPLFNKMIILTFVFTLIFGGTVFAENETAGAGNETVKLMFPDVPIGHWAQKHVSKLSLLEVVNGSNGNYNPNQSVTQEDALIMAVLLMGYKSEVNFSTDVVLPFQVSSYARPYVTLALDKGVINLQEELSTLVGDQLSNTWGKKPASREWIAKITIKAIGKSDMAAGLASQATAFTDNDRITASALGFINAAAELKIVNGLPDGSFDPKGTVTRAQVAVFFSNAEQYLSKHSERVIKGVVLERTNDRFALENELGQRVEFTVNPNMMVFNKDDNNLKLPSDIQPYSEVLLFQAQGTAYYAEIIKQAAELESITGKLVEKSVENMTISLLADGNQTSYSLASNVSVIDKSGSGSSLGSLILNSQVEIKRNAASDQSKIEQIIVREVPVNKTAGGTIQSIDAANLAVIDKDAETAQTYPISSTVALTYGGQSLFGVSELKSEDVITYEVKDGTVINIILVTPSLTTVTGTLDKDIQDGLLIYRNEAKELEVVEVDASVRVIIDGISASTIDDLVVGDVMNISMDENKIAKKIEVLGRKIQPAIVATIKGYDSSDHVLWVKYESGSNVSELLKLTEKTTIIHENSFIDLVNFSNYFTAGKKVVMNLSENRILSIELANKFEGVVVEVKTKPDSISITTDQNLLMTFPLEYYATIEIPNKTTSYFSEIKVGDEVSIVLNAAQDRARQVLLKQSRMYRTISIDTVFRRLAVNNESATRLDLVLSSTTAVTLANGNRGTMDDIPLGEPVIVSYMGKTITAVEIPSAVRGKATTVDRVNGSLSMTDYGNATQSITIGPKLSVYRANSLSTSLNSVAVNDRVEIVTAQDGSRFITVIPAQEKVFWKYNDTSKEVSFKRVNLSDQSAYKLQVNAYIHQGIQTLQLASFKDGEAVIAYIIDGKIVELEKK